MAGESEGKCDKDLDRLLQETFTNDFRTGYIKVNGVCLPELYRKYADAIENFKVHDDDIWVCSFPRTGTTWTQEMVWCIINDLDFDGAKVLLTERFPFLETITLHRIGADEHFLWITGEYSLMSLGRSIHPPWMSNGHLPWSIDSVWGVPRALGVAVMSNIVSFANKIARPRLIKTHMPFDLLPREIREGSKKPKIIYVTRNAKDTCISYFNHSKLTEGCHENFEQFCNLFLGGKLIYAPFWKHVIGYWSQRNNGNMLFLKYEDMKTDLASVIRKTTDFLGKCALTDPNVEKLIEHLSFENMKSNPAVNGREFIKKTKKLSLTAIQSSEETFMRKGEKDQWKKEMSPDMCDKFDKLTRENFGDSDHVF